MKANNEPVFFLKLEVKDHPEDAVAGQLVKDAADELLGDAPAVARDEDVGVQLPRELGLARDPRNDQKNFRK